MKKAPTKRPRVSRKQSHSDKNETTAVILDADVAEVFNSSESVNTMLRVAIRAMRTAGAKITKTTKRRAS